MGGDPIIGSSILDTESFQDFIDLFFELRLRLMSLRDDDKIDRDMYSDSMSTVREMKDLFSKRYREKINNNFYKILENEDYRTKLFEAELHILDLFLYKKSRG